MKNLLFILALFTTAFSFAQVTELDENFDLGFPSGWTLYNDTNTVHPDVAEYDTAWIVTENPDVIGDSVISSTSYFVTPNEADRWLITPKVTMGALGNYISWNELSADPSFPDAYTVMISTTDSLKTSFTDTIANVIAANPTWLKREFDLTAFGYVNQDIFVAFVCNSDDQFKLYLDSIHIVRDDPASVPEFELVSKIQVYPNPTTDLVQLPNDIVRSEVFDLNGRLVGTYRTTTISLEKFQNGTYLLKCFDQSGKEFRQKIVKK